MAQQAMKQSAQYCYSGSVLIALNSSAITKRNVYRPDVARTCVQQITSQAAYQYLTAISLVNVAADEHCLNVPTGQLII